MWKTKCKNSIQPSAPRVAKGLILCQGASRSLWPTVLWTWAPPHEVQSATWDWQCGGRGMDLFLLASYLLDTINSSSFIYVSISFHCSIVLFMTDWYIQLQGADRNCLLLGVSGSEGTKHHEAVRHLKPVLEHLRHPRNRSTDPC